jgi:hypothetical protein
VLRLLARHQLLLVGGRHVSQSSYYACCSCREARC